MALAGFAGCTDDTSSSISTGDCNGGKCDELQGEDEELDSPCASALVDRSGRGFLPKRLEEDALIKHVYMDDADGCPVDTRDVLELLNENDSTDCDGDNGMKSSVISEQAQLNDSRDNAGYRLIMSRTCNDREDFGLLVSLFGFADGAGAFGPDGDAVPGGIEVIAFDETNGVFNYYKEVGGKMGFFGSSTDYVTEGPGGPNLTSVRGCANCHTGGGLIMKELENPWLHWEEVPEAGFTDFERLSPGAGDLISNRSDILGERADGPRLEQDVIKPGNEAWNERRVQFINGNESVAKLLEPLFCPVEVNIAATFNKRRINHDFLVDRSLLDSLGLNASGRINTDESDYDAMLELTESIVPGSNQSDTRQNLAHITRSFSDIDYVEKLIDAGLIDREFANDVLMVDFTRQVFSDERCDLLEFAPDIDTADRNPESIRDGFLANLPAVVDGTAAAQLRAHLQARVDGNAFDHVGIVENFLDSCSDRQTNDQFASTNTDHSTLLGASELVIDSLKLRSQGVKLGTIDGNRDSADGSATHPRDVFEFGDTFPSDGIRVVANASLSNPLAVHPDARFSPVDCLLVDEFVALEAPAPVDPSASSCPGTCGEFVNGAACQCDDRCQDFGNCCPGWEPVRDACPGEPFEFVNGAACQCDDRCNEFGNCCDGWEPMCVLP
jgi:hypothetical protein